MRRLLALTLLAGAVALTAAPASAGCYGVQGWATACFDGNPVPTVGTWTWCVYTGGTTCENVEHPGPSWPEGIDLSPEVCVFTSICA